MVEEQKTSSDNVLSRQQTGKAEDFISIVAPFYNESEVIEYFYKELKGVLDVLEGITYEMIFVDDGSEDDTLTKLNCLAESDSKVRVYSLSRNFGHQIALTAGLDAARGAAVIMMDGDLQHPCKLIPEMIKKWRQGFEIVIAVREHTQDASWFKQLTSKIFYRLFNFMSDTNVHEGAADFTLLSRKSHQILRNMPERHRFLRGMVSWIGMSRALVRYQAPKRAAGRSKYSLLKMVSLAVEATLSFSTMPLRLATRAGFVITCLGFLYFVWIILRYLFVGDLVLGWGSLICVVLIVGGAQLSFIGLVGQYLARVFEEVKNRPIYIFKQSPSGQVVAEEPQEKKETT
jgi:glycosyltransferase involved in cell wall biosynthesis